MARATESRSGGKTEPKRTKKEGRNRFNLSDNQKWIAGLILFFFAIYTLWICLSYFFTWHTDQTLAGIPLGTSTKTAVAIAESGIEGMEAEAVGGWAEELASAADAISTGEKGRFGVRFTRLVIGRGFGVFAIAIPVIFIILSLRLMRYRPPALERSVRVTASVMILGSVTLGLVIGTRWGVFGSGLGGETGIFTARWLREMIGLSGAGLALLCMWILLAVYISRKNISRVNRVGRVIADGGTRVGELVTGMGRGHDHEYSDNPEDEDRYGNDCGDDFDDGKDYSADGSEDYEPTEYKCNDCESDAQSGIPAEVLSTLWHEHAAPNSPFVVRDITGGHVVEVEKPVDPVHQTVVITHDGIFEVVELEPTGDSNPTTGSGTDGLRTTLGAGGVVASNGQWMEVLQTEQRDTEMDDDDIENRLYDPLRELSTYHKPEIESILANHGTRVEVTDEEIQANSNRIVQTLKNFGIEISKIKATIGPTVTLYEIIPAPGVKISKIKGLEQDIALSLKALGIRIIAPMPGKGTIGIEVPNQNREVVSMYSLVKSIRFQDSTAELPLVLGKTIQNETFLVDLAKMPHLLIAGATGQGKSVGLNVIISSLLYKKHPAEVKFVMVDPKKVELSLYARLENHFLAKMESEEDAILTDTQKVVYTLNSLCGEMEARYELLRKAAVKKISEYNEKFINRRLNPNKGHRYLPYIVVVIDEFADMIMTAGKEVEQPITRLAQLARATGIHLIIATQRPDVKVITGLIKANFPARIAFRVTSIVDSRTILDQTGANQLIGQGDMLISLNGEITRLQCAFIDTPEIERMTQFIQDQRGYTQAYALPDWMPDGGDSGSAGGDLGDVDRMFEEVARFVVANQQGSTSNIQRHFAIGYNRAGRLMDQLERAGIVGRAEGSKPREVLIQDPRSLERIFEDLGIL
ncbi:MAG: DNA translocase FtsK [Alistipes sp.]|jgi:S-DNA-T family DNA segregation ATPase FtsK/SpoIIIE|nr:DNA translocase FtsK [Alistipes sp.]